MKKLFALAIVAGMVAFVACGPSKKDIEAKEKAKQDSVNAAERARREADSLANVERERRHLDSLRQDSMAKADKKPLIKGFLKKCFNFLILYYLNTILNGLV